MFFVMYTLETQTDTKKKQNFFFMAIPKKTQAVLLSVVCMCYILLLSPLIQQVDPTTHFC